MLIVGLLSSKQEVTELKHIAKICQVEDRIHFLVRMQRVKDLLREERRK